MTAPALLTKDTGITLALALALCAACFSAGIFYQSHQEHGQALLELKQIARTNSDLLLRQDVRITRLEQLVEDAVGLQDRPVLSVPRGRNGS